MALLTISDDDLFKLARELYPGCNPVGWTLTGNLIQVISDDEPEPPKPKAKAKPKDDKPDEE